LERARRHEFRDENDAISTLRERCVELDQVRVLQRLQQLDLVNNTLNFSVFQTLDVYLGERKQ
jgi:hypothetical protein